MDQAESPASNNENKKVDETPKSLADTLETHISSITQAVFTNVIQQFNNTPSKFSSENQIKNEPYNFNQFYVEKQKSVLSNEDLMEIVSRVVSDGKLMKSDSNEDVVCQGCEIPQRKVNFKSGLCRTCEASKIKCQVYGNDSDVDSDASEEIIELDDIEEFAELEPEFDENLLTGQETEDELISIAEKLIRHYKHPIFPQKIAHLLGLFEKKWYAGTRKMLKRRGKKCCIKCRKPKKVHSLNRCGRCYNAISRWRKKLKIQSYSNCKICNEFSLLTCAGRCRRCSNRRYRQNMDANKEAEQENSTNTEKEELDDTVMDTPVTRSSKSKLETMLPKQFWLPISTSERNIQDLPQSLNIAKSLSNFNCNSCKLEIGSNNFCPFDSKICRECFKSQMYNNMLMGDGPSISKEIPTTLRSIKKEIQYVEISSDDE